MEPAYRTRSNRACINERGHTAATTGSGCEERDENGREDKDGPSNRTKEERVHELAAAHVGHEATGRHLRALGNDGAGARLQGECAARAGEGATHLLV